MRVEQIHRWQWIVIALVVGFLIASVRNHYLNDDVTGYGNSMNGQQQFESAIRTHERLPNGEARPLFYKLVVLNIKDPDPPALSMDDTIKLFTPAQKKKYDSMNRSDQGAYAREIRDQITANRRTYAVAGVYYNGRPSQNPKTNQYEKVWHPYLFITPTPYKPLRQFAVAGPVPALKPTLSDKLQSLAEKLHLKDPDPPNSALSYLNALKAQGQVEFTYQWWKAPRVAIATWMAGTLVVIGGVWPTLINLLVYGRFTRPYEEKVDLSKVRNTSMAARASREPTAEELAQLKALEEKLEADLAASASNSPLSPSDQPAPQPVKVLTAKELEVAAAASASGESHEYAAKPDDFYPTEKRAKHKDEH